VQFTVEALFLLYLLIAVRSKRTKAATPAVDEQLYTILIRHSLHSAMSVIPDSTQDSLEAAVSSLFLVTKDNVALQAPIAHDLLERFNLPQIQSEFAHTSIPNTFKSYIDHLPGEFHISKRGRVPVGASIKAIVSEQSSTFEDEEPIDFGVFSEQVLQDAFTLQDGGFKKKKKKKKKKDNGTPNGADGTKQKKRKRQKDSQENTTPIANGEQKHKKKKKKKGDLV